MNRRIHILLYGGAILAELFLAIQIKEWVPRVMLFILILIQGAILVLEQYHIFYSTERMKEAIENNDTIVYEKELQSVKNFPLSSELGEIIQKCVEFEIRKNNEEIFDRQTQLMALQSQINPHFLYNTLDSIRGLAMRHDNVDVAEMTETLSAFFRYSISGRGSQVHLRDEINNVMNYMKIQKYRFDNRFSLDIEIDEEDRMVYDLYIPRLILQPIVENAIVHGLDDIVENADITIDVAVSDELIITVSDNGKGMTLQELDELNDRIHEDSLKILKSNESDRRLHSGGIALPNIQKRIVLMYGKQYGLNVYSSIGHGTDVEIILPILKYEGREA